MDNALKIDPNGIMENNIIRLVCPTNNGSKFWECEVIGTTYTVRFGTVGFGNRVATRTKNLETHEKAIAEMHKTANQKMRTGYA